MDYRTIFELSPIGLILLGETFEECNELACQLLACKRDDILGHSLLDFSPPRQPSGRDSKKSAQEYTVAALSGAPQSFPWQIKCKDGGLVDTELSMKTIEIEGRDFILLGMQDITDRKRAVEALRESEALLSVIFNESTQLMGVMEPNGTLIKANRMADESTSADLSQELNKPFWETSWWSHSLKEQKRLREAISRAAQGELVRLEATHPTPEGGLMYVEMSLNPVKDGTGKVVLLVTESRDITEKKGTELKLHQTLAELEEAKQQLTIENVYLKEEIGQTYNSHNIVGSSPVLKDVLMRVRQVANTRATVLILGETGTGKELIARAIHESSDRQSRPLVKVNCATLPATLIESELFGHEKGAFTGATTSKAGRFELADKGTIFLDEIGEMPLDLQAKLLRVLQEGEFERLGSEQTKRVDVRIIAATNRDLHKLSANGEFRLDLYYRLNVFPIICPLLRKRKEDIPLLAEYFVKKFAGEIGRRIVEIPEEEIGKLISHHWPGNLREFQNIIESSVITSMDGVFRLESWFKPSGVPTAGSSGGIASMEENERSHIISALEATDCRVSGEKGAAKILDMNAQTLTSRIKKLGISMKTLGK